MYDAKRLFMICQNYNYTLSTLSWQINPSSSTFIGQSIGKSPFPSSPHLKLYRQWLLWIVKCYSRRQTVVEGAYLPSQCEQALYGRVFRNFNTNIITHSTHELLLSYHHSLCFLQLHFNTVLTMSAPQQWYSGAVWSCPLVLHSGYSRTRSA